MATTAFEKIWQHHLTYGRYIQNHNYELALFFLAVKTNIGYSVVGEFVVQSETADQIAEALSILSSWNPEWQPSYFITDNSEAEMGAITTFFPICQMYLCDFHREQSWERWTKDRKHGLSSDDAEVLLSLLRDCAHSIHKNKLTLEMPCVISACQNFLSPCCPAAMF